MSFTDVYENIIDTVAVTIHGKEVKRIAPPKRIFNYFMQPAYDDWRRYMSNYYLYLPFVGIINLEAEKYINHTLGCDLMFDVRTGNLKYNILSDDVVLESFEGCCRVSLPCTTASPYAAARAKIAGAMDVAKGAGSMAVGIATGVAGASVAEGTTTMNIGGGGLKSIASGLTTIARPIPKRSTGGFTPGTNMYDSLHVYLITEAPEIFYGDGILERYGKPDKRFMAIGNCTGYVEISDIDLRTGATESEQEEIKGLLLGGVVI